MKNESLITYALGLGLGVYMGVIVKELHDTHKLKKRSAPEKSWSQKTIEEKEAWIRLHEGLMSKGDGFKAGINALKEDLYSDIRKARKTEEDINPLFFQKTFNKVRRYRNGKDASICW